MADAASDRRFVLKVAAMVAFALLGTGGAFLAAWFQENRLEDARFQSIAEEALAELANRMQDYEQVLRSGVALLQVHPVITREDWRQFVAGLEVDGRLEGLQGIGISPRVMAGQLARHERLLRAQGVPGYRVEPPGNRPEYFPIAYLEPLDERNLRAIGFDMWSEPTRRAAMAAARNSGRTALTAPLTLVQETATDVQRGALLYRPFYVAGPRGQGRVLGGFVYSPLRMNDLFTAVMGRRLAHLCLVVNDAAAGPGGRLYANSDCQAGRFALQRTISVYGRQWVVEVHSSRALDRSFGSTYLYLMVAAGTIVGALLSWLIATSIDERHRSLALADANRDLEVARRQAEAANLSKSRFLAAASHDLRQPLQTLGIYLYLWRERSPMQLARLAMGATMAFESAQRLLNSLMDISAFEAGNLEPRLSTFDVAELLGSIARETRPDAASRGLTLRTRLAPVTLDTDPVMVERVVRNILDNAVKYTERGAILLACRPGAGGARITIADSGPGIPADRQALVFEEFYQLGNTERDPRKGFGLGLATVARVCRLLGCTIKLYSRPGKGSTFVLTVPSSPPLRSPG